MKTSIAIVSGKGGVGKTTLAVNLAAALHQFGIKTVAIDGDSTASNLALHLNMEPTENPLQNVLKGEIDILEAIHVHPSGIMVIPSPFGLRNIEFDARLLRGLYRKLNSLVIVDAPPGFVNDVFSIIESVEKIIIVTTPEIPAIADALKIIKYTSDIGKEENIIGVVVNMVRNKKYEVNIPEIEISLEIPVIARIPYDNEVKKSIFYRTPLIIYNPYSKAAVEIKQLAAWLIGKEYKPSFYERVRGLFRLR